MGSRPHSSVRTSSRPMISTQGRYPCGSHACQRLIAASNPPHWAHPWSGWRSHLRRLPGSPKLFNSRDDYAGDQRALKSLDNSCRAPAKVRQIESPEICSSSQRHFHVLASWPTRPRRGRQTLPRISSFCPFVDHRDCFCGCVCSWSSSLALKSCS